MTANYLSWPYAHFDDCKQNTGHDDKSLEKMDDSVY